MFSPKILTTTVILTFILLWPIAASQVNGAAAGPAAAGATFSNSGQNLGAGLSSDVLLGDLDNDGDLDAFVVAIDPGSSVWFNQGGAQSGQPGFFADSGQNLTPNLGVSGDLGDLDGDGDLDAFVLRDAANDSNQVWLNKGGVQSGAAGTFALSGQIFGDDVSSAVALGDLDGDGDLDAFIARSVGRADKVWLNNGSGQFTDSGQALGSDSGSDVALGDVDGDGDLDAFVVNGGANRLWLNDSSGRFTDSGQALGNVLSLAVALSDVDGDGDLDAFVANSGPDRVWLNQGGVQGGTRGQFALSGQALGSTQSRDAGLADLDGDGDPDVMVARFGGNLVYLNQGGAQGGTAGNFSDSGQSLGDAQSEGEALGDLDGDGDPDAYVANFDIPDQVWLNQSPTPPQSGADVSIEISGNKYMESAFFPPHIYEITVYNHGPDTATGVIVREETNRGAQSSTSQFGPPFRGGTQGNCVAGSSCGEWSFGDLPSGQSASVEFSAIGRDFINYNEVTAERIIVISVAGMNVDPDPTNNQDRFATYFYNCDNLGNACLVAKTFCKALTGSHSFENVAQPILDIDLQIQPSSEFRWDYASPLELLQPYAEAVIDIVVFYSVRDLMLKNTANGEHYIDLYYTHDPEISALLEADPNLEAEGIATLKLWEPNLLALVEGQGETAVITAEQVQAVDQFLANLAAAAGPALQQTIAAERDRLPPLDSLAGRTMADVHAEIIGHEMYLPLVTRP